METKEQIELDGVKIVVREQQKLIAALQHSLELLEDVVIKDQPKFYPLSERVDQLENNAKNVQTILEEHAKDTSKLCRIVAEKEECLNRIRKSQSLYSKQLAKLTQAMHDEKERVDHLEQRIEAHAEMLNEHEKWQEKRNNFYADPQSAANWPKPGDPDWNINNPLAKASDQVQFTPFPEIVQDLSCQIAQMKRETQGMVTELEQLRKFKGHCKDRLPILKTTLELHAVESDALNYLWYQLENLK